MPSATKKSQPLERTRCVSTRLLELRVYRVAGRVSLMGARFNHRTLQDVDVGRKPATKKRKLENGASLASQPSFTDVLERLKKEEGTNAAGEFDSIPSTTRR